MPEQLVFLRMMINGTPPTGVSPNVNTILNFQKNPPEYTLPTAQDHIRKRRALFALNGILGALLLGVAEEVGLNLDGKNIAGWEVLAFFFPVFTKR